MCSKMNKVKFNGMDLFIVIVLVAVIAAGGYLLLGRGGGAAASNESVEVTTVVELTAKDKEFSELINEGDIVLIGEKEKMRTSVEKVEAVPARTTGYDIIDGRVLYAEVPDKYDVKITLVGEGTETESAIEMNGAAIRVGQGAALNSKNWAGYGYVIGLDVE